MLTNIFKQAEILNKDKHKDLKTSEYKNFEFTKDAYIVPVGFEEMIIASKSMIMVFIRDDSGDILPAIVLGGEGSGNVLLNEEYVWRADKYIPAALRAYPFGVGTDGENTFITIDTKAKMFKDNQGYQIVQDKDTLTEYGNRAINFVTSVYAAIHETKEFTKFLDEIGVLKNAQISIEYKDKQYDLQKGIYIVDENALNKLESRKIKKLATMGYMKFIYAHLLSLSNSY